MAVSAVPTPSWRSSSLRCLPALPPEEYRVTDLILIDVKNMLVDAAEGRGEMFVELPARWGRDSPVCSR